MESLFEVGDIVYVQGKVISVEEQENDVRYSVITSIAKYFCTEKKDKIRRSADSQNMLKKSFNEGRESYHEVLTHMLEMEDSVREEVFGFAEMGKIIENYPEAANIIDLYSNWYNAINVNVSDIVTYRDSEAAYAETYEAIVLTAMVKINNQYINCDDLTESQQASPAILATKKLSLYDPVNRQFFFEIPVTNITPVGKKINANAYFDDMKEEFERIMNDDEEITGAPIITQVKYKNDVNYDDYYNEDALMVEDDNL